MKRMTLLISLVLCACGGSDRPIEAPPPPPEALPPEPEAPAESQGPVDPGKEPSNLPPEPAPPEARGGTSSQ